ncbi:cell wall assembly regulator SMI1 [Acinetobacter calcoaceticus]|uniref:Cell wall assembly regulator SMI1 n=1 Tax=Acinetobacter calcoaceticus TaxID=471 RepID=A0A4R1Y0F4_ACICA|nr:cell wall assembly regulator SMI1 [Acinetobacter calcoaceticus]
MQHSLQQIQHWLEQHAPRITTYSLQAPATDQQFGRIEKLLATPLLNGFKSLYLWHNGLSDQVNGASLFYGMDFYSLEHVEDVYRAKSDMVDQLIELKYADVEIDPCNVFNPNWLQFADDRSHSGLYIDLAPTAQGQYGQVIFIDEECEVALKVADSIEALVAQFSLDIEQGYYQLDQDALEDGDEFLACDTEIDLINWQDSQRWRRKMRG